jgi:hypothetical protein
VRMGGESESGGRVRVGAGGPGWAGRVGGVGGWLGGWAGWPRGWWVDSVGGRGG